MKSLLLSPTLMDLSLRRDLHLSIVLQVTASVPESFVEIGVWGGVKKKKKDLISVLVERKAPLCVCWSCLPVFTAEGMLCAMETSAGD